MKSLWFENHYADRWTTPILPVSKIVYIITTDLTDKRYTLWVDDTRYKGSDVLFCGAFPSVDAAKRAVLGKLSYAEIILLQDQGYDMDPVQAKKNTSEKKYRKKLLRWRTYKDGAYTYWLAFHGSNTLSCYEIEKGTNDYTVWRELRGGPRSSLVSIQISSRPTLKAAKQRALEDFLGHLSAAELIALEEAGYDVSPREANWNPKKRYGSRPASGQALNALRQSGCEPTSRALEVETQDGPMWEVQTTCGVRRVGRRAGTDNLEIRKC